MTEKLNCPSVDKNLAPSSVRHEIKSNSEMIERSSSVTLGGNCEMIEKSLSVTHWSASSADRSGDENLVWYPNRHSGDMNLNMAPSSISQASEVNFEMDKVHGLNPNQSLFPVITEVITEAELSSFSINFANYEKSAEEILFGIPVGSPEDIFYGAPVTSYHNNTLLFPVGDEGGNTIDTKEKQVFTDCEIDSNLDDSWIQDLNFEVDSWDPYSMDSDDDFSKPKSDTFQNEPSIMNNENKVCSTEYLSRDIANLEPNTIQTEMTSLNNRKSEDQEEENEECFSLKEESFGKESADLILIDRDVEVVDVNEMFSNGVSTELEIETSHHGKKETINFCNNVSPSAVDIQSSLYIGLLESSDGENKIEFLDSNIKEAVDIQGSLSEERNSTLNIGLPESSDRGNKNEFLDSDIKEGTQPSKLEMEEAWTSTVPKHADDISRPSNVIPPSTSSEKTTVPRKSARLAKHMSMVGRPIPMIKFIEETKCSSISSQTSDRTYCVGADTKKEDIQNPTMSDVFSQIYLAGSKPKTKFSFMPTLTNFLSDFRDKIYQEHAGSKRGKRKRVAQIKKGKRSLANAKSVLDQIYSPCPGQAKSKSGKKMRADTWSAGEEVPHDTVGHSEDIQKLLQPNSQRKNRRMNTVIQESTALLDNSNHSQKTEKKITEDYSLQQEYSAAKSENKDDEKTTNECTETSLIMFFPESVALPSEAQLNNIFSRYGPLVEELTEVRKTEKHAHVVFRIRTDAETAYTNARKSNRFGKQVFYDLKSISTRANDYEE